MYVYKMRNLLSFRHFEVFSGHFNQPKLRKAIDRHARAIGQQCFLEFRNDGIAVYFIVHVDKIDDDDATQVAQA